MDQFLSAGGRRIQFPVGGILIQTARAQGARVNATVGVALRDDRAPMGLPSLEASLGVPSAEALPYAPSHGKLPLRKLWGELIRSKNPSLRGTTSTPVVVAGLTHGLRIAAELFLDPGDEILLAAPYWENYDLVFQDLSQARLCSFPLFDGQSFHSNGLRVALQHGPRKKVLLLNFPNNPTGYSPRQEEAAMICDAIRACADGGSEIVVIIDDAYFGLVYEEGVFRESLFAPLSHLHERVLAVKVDGCSKEDYAWGLRVGFLTYGGKGLRPEDLRALEDKTAAVIRGTLSNVSHLSQSIILRTLQSSTYWEERRANAVILERRFRAAWTAANHAAASGFFRVLPCNAGYFLCLELCGGLSAGTVQERLLQEHGIGVVTVGERLLRVAFSAIPEAGIPAVFRSIAQVCSSHPLLV
ncbi:aminotransferase class I/II-fold pyridoxal phosphate-dependent enzyme [Candidatus Peregrinibacteria bacterium]|nr:aminotransferase class I/II-fold pyridoxal phosphate-dependent enzyme [Candidatus Peregrinibacteria bacterium]